MKMNEKYLLAIAMYAVWGSSRIRCLLDDLVSRCRFTKIFAF